MPDIYQTAWEILSDRIARSRKQSISKTDLLEWRLQALEAAVNKACFEKTLDTRTTPGVRAIRHYAGVEEGDVHQGRYPPGSLHEQVQHGEQEKA